MSHVDEGALHAYLDGALEEYPTGEARRIRAHLERCETCARALAEARRVRDEADMLLAIPDVDVSLPPLEELRRMAQSAPGGDMSPRRVPLYRLGWAASVVLALGVGWMLRGGVPQESASVASVPAAAAPEAAEQEAPARQATPSSSTLAAASEEAAVATDLAAGRQAEPARVQESRVAEAIPAAPTPSELPEVDVTAVEMAYADETDSADEVVADMAATFEDRMVAGDQVAQAPVVMPEPPAEPATEAGAARVADAGTADTPRAQERSVVAGRRLALEARSAPVASGLQVGGGTAAADVEERELADDATEPGSLVVPGLEVVTIVWREEGVVPAGVRVIQRLDDGGLLELIHLPAGFDPAAVEAAEPGTGELVVPRDQGWLIMRAPLAEEDLRTLLERMDAPSPE